MPLGEARVQFADEVADGVELEARELAQHESDQIINFDGVKLTSEFVKSHTPRSGPFTPERNQEIFKAVLYLMDAEKKKRPNVLDEYECMRWYYARKRGYWKWCLGVACFLYILVSLTETPSFDHLVNAPGKDWYEVVLEVICDSIFAIDIFMQAKGKGFRKTLNNRWTQIFCVLLVFDFVGVIWQGLRLLMVTGIVRAFPIVYYSKRSRNAMINYSKTLPSVLLWIGLEIFVVVLYACIAVVLYAHIDKDGRSGQDAMRYFKNAFIALYSLSLTVNDPDIYLPYYKLDFLNILVFASFMIITFFMIHNIILSRVFQIYSNKLKETAIKRRENRHRALFLAFEALDENKSGVLPKDLLAYVLTRLRPTYSGRKIETLMKHSNKRNPNEYNFDQFEQLMASLDDRVHKIRQTKFYPATLTAFVQRSLDAAVLAHLLIVLISIMDYWNFFYSVGFWTLIFFFRILFTADVIYRMRATGGPKYFLKDSFNILNVIAILFSIIALISLCQSIQESHGLLDLEPYTRSKKIASLAILLTSCCDIGRIFNRIPEYAALLTVFGKLLPAFIGQATVVFTMMHVFCYIGMYVFGGRIYPTHPMWAFKDFPGNLYYMLNFNTYKEGMVTLYMLLIVNNWNLIAANFVEVTSGSSYLYFMAFQIAVVTIGLNCVTSFFIGNLSNKLEEELERQNEERRKHKDEQERIKARAASGGGVTSSTAHVIKFRVERRVSSDDLMLANEEPIQCEDYRSLLDAIIREMGERTGYSFIKDDADTDVPQTVQRSPYFIEIVDRYGGEMKILQIVKAVFKEENAKRNEREDSGAADPSTPYLVIDETLQGNTGSLAIRIYFSIEGEQLLAYCQVREDSHLLAPSDMYLRTHLPTSLSHCPTTYQPTGNTGSLAIRIYFLIEGEQLLAYCQVREDSHLLAPSSASAPPAPTPTAPPAIPPPRKNNIPSSPATIA